MRQLPRKCALISHADPVSFDALRIDLLSSSYSPALNTESLSIAPGSPVRISILGSTGSIGTQTLDIARLFPERLKIVVLTAGSNVDLLSQQAAEFEPECVVIAETNRDALLKSSVTCNVLSGVSGLKAAASWPGVDIVVTALVGAAGLIPTLEAIKCGRRVALANKETMVVAGDLIQQMALEFDSHIIPVDSEHSAIYQCLVGEPRDSVDRLIITASGGPFLNRSVDTFDQITRAEALNHPNWKMGTKITIDSATMMNKGLEVIEARWLFGIDPERIDVVIHPESVIHSMVLFQDGSTKAQIGPPDMKVPIQYALSAPDRWTADHGVINWNVPLSLNFQAPDLVKYRCLSLAYEALREGGAMTAVMSAANEVAVGLFLDEKLGFSRIPGLIEDVMMRIQLPEGEGIESRIEADADSRRLAVELAGVDAN